MLQRALFVNGTCGSGKSTIAAATADLIAQAGIAVAFVDMDALSQTWPRPPDDPFNKALGLKNLVSVVRNFTDAGVPSVVIAGVIQDEEDLARYEAALGLRPTVVRLLAPLRLIDERLQRRYGDTDPDGMAWHRERAPELDAVLDASVVEMTSISNTASILDVARSALAVGGWLPLSQ